MNKIIRFFIFTAGLLLWQSCNLPIESSRGKDSFLKEYRWSLGFLDIHHIHTGRGDAALAILPDGTSLLFDAGDAKQRDKHPYYPVYPSTDKTPGQWIANYIKQVNPKQTLDYAVISHFHKDHYGHIENSTPFSSKGEYQLSGITEVGDIITIKTIVDRGFPDYQYPLDMRKFLGGDNTFNNYLNFLSFQSKRGVQIERCIPGANDQFVLRYKPQKFPDVEIRNVKSNQKIWTGKGSAVSEFKFDPPLLHEEGKFSQNSLSIALKISYGPFDYYTGGDIPGFIGNHDYDVESQVAKALAEVDALALNHHGHKDATNSNFLSQLKPQIAVHQGIHDPHFDMGVMTRLLEQKVDVFSIQMSSNVMTRFPDLIKELYKSKNGHVLVRVLPGGREFYVIILENDQEKLVVKKHFGPYNSRN